MQHSNQDTWKATYIEESAVWDHKVHFSHVFSGLFLGSGLVVFHSSSWYIFQQERIYQNIFCVLIRWRKNFNCFCKGMTLKIHFNLKKISFFWVLGIPLHVIAIQFRDSCKGKKLVIEVHLYAELNFLAHFCMLQQFSLQIGKMPKSFFYQHLFDKMQSSFNIFVFEEWELALSWGEWLLGSFWLHGRQVLW